MIRALIFDFDGLIIDTEKTAYQSWQEIYVEHGCALPLETWAQCIGNADLFDPLDYLEELLGKPVSRDELSERRRLRHLELIEESVALPGVELYLQEAKRFALKLAVASSSPRSWVVQHLTRLGLLDYFDRLCCGDEVTNKKPDPELFLTALRFLELEPAEAIVLEDSPNGVRAANRAGIFSVAVPNPITGQLPLEHADLRLSSMAALPLQELLDLVQERQKAS
ncbi:MAG TPA: HAD family hydrolase [Ktedonobacteraceae bacterium]|jgi:HAD superfamily hydrolase (TIGR01509 family)|nr:HAD family hydrolase [Ktedonobacteraceae bacterium]